MFTMRKIIRMVGFSLALVGLIVSAGCTPPKTPTIITNSLPEGTEGVAYSHTLEVHGGSPPYIWSVTGGKLPIGLQLNPTTGVISGTPMITTNPAFVTFMVTDNSKTYQSGQQISIVVDETNIRSKTNKVTASDKWPIDGLTVGQCGTYNYPFGIAILRGEETVKYISTATPLILYNPNIVIQGCVPDILNVNAYNYKPLSDIATLDGEVIKGSATFNTSAEIPISGYWAGSPNAVQQNFEPGVYTIVAGDEWGDLVVVHFTVTSTITSTSPPTSSVGAEITTSPPVTNLNGVTSASSASANGLSLSLSLKSAAYSPGQEISITIDEKNTFSTENVVPIADKWLIDGLSLNPCGTSKAAGYSYGIAIFQGDYTPANISNAMPLNIYDPNDPWLCVPYPGNINAYDFMPSIDIASVIDKSNPDQKSYAMNNTITTAFYWTGSSSNEIKHNFEPGIYTVVAGDEWGNLVILHFTVA